MSIAAVDQEHRVTPRELFFDLVFVFAFTQVATLLADDPTFTGIGRGVLVLAALWWAWAAYAWYSTTTPCSSASRSSSSAQCTWRSTPSPRAVATRICYGRSSGWHPGPCSARL
jgi:Bacterial low temperature requirement A protein (LtrA)